MADKAIGAGQAWGMDSKRFACTQRWVFALLAVCLLAAPARADESSEAPADGDTTKILRAERVRFQKLTMKSAAGGYVVSPGQEVRITWDDYEAAMELGATSVPLRARWFDAKFHETTGPLAPGRWGVRVEGLSPNGMPMRRSLTFYARPPFFLWYSAPNDFSFPPQPGPISKEVWSENQTEIDALGRDMMADAINRSPSTAIMLSAWGETNPTPGREPTSLESAVEQDHAYHLALKLHLTGRDADAHALPAPRHLEKPATVLHKGTAAEAGMKPDTRHRMDDLCRRWAEATGEPFTVLVARHGVVVLHGAYGKGEDGKPVGLDYRGDIASITKSITGILFARFLDDGRVDLDDSVAGVFDDFPPGDPHVPTFRDCFMHMSGLEGHGSHGGVGNPDFENIVLGGLDTLAPGTSYAYTGTGYDLMGKAMEIWSGKTARRLLVEDLFRPLGLSDIPMNQMGMGARPTVWELAVFGQLLANGGSYGNVELFGRETFEKMLPRSYAEMYPGVDVKGEQPYGLGLGLRDDRRRVPEAVGAADVDTTMTAEQRLKAAVDAAKKGELLSERTIGHGALSQSIYRIDLETGLVFTMIRRQGGKDFGKWCPQFFEAVADSVVGGE
jgi:CubicO group peptidase (beta-lactamase class C family)